MHRPHIESIINTVHGHNETRKHSNLVVCTRKFNASKSLLHPFVYTPWSQKTWQYFMSRVLSLPGLLRLRKLTLITLALMLTISIIFEAH